MIYIYDINIYIWGFIKKKKNDLSITYSWRIGFWEHDIEASKMQGRARGRKGERKTYHIWQKRMYTMEFGIYWLNVAKPPRAQERARGPILPKSYKEFSTTPIYIHIYLWYIYIYLWYIQYVYMYIYCNLLVHVSFLLGSMSPAASWCLHFHSRGFAVTNCCREQRATQQGFFKGSWQGMEV